MRILIMGAGGQLGAELTGVLSRSAHEVTGLTREACDIRDAHAVDGALLALDPQAVINCAAWTKVDAAEEHRGEAFAINALGAGNVARVCRDHGSVLVHVSTDFVFAGDATSPIAESAPPHPVSVYGESKLAGELLVRDVIPDAHAIVRTAWLYGQHGPNFVLTMLRLARERGQLRVVADQTGSPTWTGDLAPAIVRLLEAGARGTFHLTNSGATTWHGFATAIVAAAGLDVQVEAIGTSEYPTPARRPQYSVLDNRRWHELGEPPLPAWEDGLRAYMASGAAQ